jgi:hypothetical protein
VVSGYDERFAVLAPTIDTHWLIAANLFNAISLVSQRRISKSATS